MSRKSISAGGNTLIFFLVTGVLIWGEFGGIYHAFKAHGNIDGCIAVATPPYAWFRSMELFFHKDSDVVVGYMDKRQSMPTRDLQLPDDEWKRLTQYIQNLKNHEYRTTQTELGSEYVVVVSVLLDGSVTLRLNSKGQDMKVSLVDQNSDQNPDLIIVTTFVQGKEQNKEGAMDDLDSEERKELLISWRFIWAKILDELKPSLAQL